MTKSGGTNAATDSVRELFFPMFTATLFVVPSLEGLYTDSAKSTKLGWFARRQQHFFNFIQKTYEKSLSFCFKRPRLTIAFGITVIILGILMFTDLNVQMMPKAKRDCFVVEIYLESGSGIDKATLVSDSISSTLRKDGRVKSVTSFIGTSSPRFHATYAPQLPSPDFAQLIVNTNSTDDTEYLLEEMDESCIVVGTASSS